MKHAKSLTKILIFQEITQMKNKIFEKRTYEQFLQQKKCKNYE